MNRSYRDPVTGVVHPERRSGRDRRERAGLLGFIGSGFRRRRSRGRRRTDKGAYVDIYDSRTWSMAGAILLLALVDALLTVIHVGGGSATELNPVLRVAIDQGGWVAFFAVKGALTVIPVFLIMVHKEWAFGRFAARLCLWSYLLLALYHLYLLLNNPGV